MNRNFDSIPEKRNRRTEVKDAHDRYANKEVQYSLGQTPSRKNNPSNTKPDSKSISNNRKKHKK